MIFLEYGFTGNKLYSDFSPMPTISHPDINFTYTYGENVSFLDVAVAVEDSRLVADLFTKPTDTHQYLLPSSNHPSNAHQNLPYGLAIRLRVIVSENTTLDKRLGQLANFSKGPRLARWNYQQTISES